MGYQVKIYGFNYSTQEETEPHDLIDYDDKSMILLEPELEDEVNKTGSFDFIMPPTHRYYSVPQPYQSTIEIYEDNDLIWFGRVISIEIDYYRQKKVHCEGPMGWFNDTVQRYHEYDQNVNLHDFFADIIDVHNSMVLNNRKFTVGNVTVENKSVYRRLDYESTEEAIQKMCIEAEGGYIFFRRVNGINYIDWLASMPYTCNQPVEFGLNMTDITSNFDGGEIITALLPLGDTVQANNDSSKGEIIPETDPRVGKPLTLEHDYDSDLIGSDEAIRTFGKIIEVVNFSGIKDAATLKTKAEAYLEERLLNKLTFEVTAVELSKYGPGANDNYDHFKLGQMIRCKSIPHALDLEFPLMKINIKLDSAEKEITIGTMPHQTLTEIIRNET